MRNRALQLLLISSMLWLSWLTMMLVHECGHVIGARCTGGHVQRVVWHPAVISRTDIRPNPHPLLEIWAGPVIGSVAPLTLAVIASACRLRFAYLLWFVAGFCLIANGAYIGIGVLRPVGDAEELIRHGMPHWPLGIFGAGALIGGLGIWQTISPRLGFGRLPAAICARHAYGGFALAGVVTAVGFAFGHR